MHGNEILYANINFTYKSENYMKKKKKKIPD